MTTLPCVRPPMASGSTQGSAAIPKAPALRAPFLAALHRQRAEAPIDPRTTRVTRDPALEEPQNKHLACRDERPRPPRGLGQQALEGEGAERRERARSRRRGVEGIEHDPREGLELQPFRPSPAILLPPPEQTVPRARPELARLAEQLVTRLRVGRAREGALVELRLSLGAQEVDVRLVEGARGIVLETDAEPGLRAAIERELAARGLSLAAG
ncbi:MAG: hypothetical protein K1X94_25285 [Sandaracinaceae bacterium]|nr:hypothetical protein [Sandaracinaceae bacterium]